MKVGGGKRRTETSMTRDHHPIGTHVARYVQRTAHGGDAAHTRKSLRVGFPSQGKIGQWPNRRDRDRAGRVIAQNFKDELGAL